MESKYWQFQQQQQQGLNCSSITAYMVSMDGQHNPRMDYGQSIRKHRLFANVYM